VDPETSSRRSTHNRRLTSGQGTRSARCGESRTPGAGRRPRETPGGNTGTAPWADLTVHKRAELRAFTSAQPWLRVFWLPAYAPDLNPVEGIWSVLKRGVLANLAVASLAHLVHVIRHGLKKIQYRPGLIEGCLAGTGLTLNPD
jgi:DDE superfamily endonuclease